MNVSGSLRALERRHHFAPTAPSTVRWSQLRVTFIRLTVLKPRSSSGLVTRVGFRRADSQDTDCGGFDNGREVRDVKHAQVRNRECAALNECHSANCPGAGQLAIYTPDTLVLEAFRTRLS